MKTNLFTKFVSLLLSALTPFFTWVRYGGHVDKTKFTGSDYTIQRIDLSVKPEGLDEKFDYLYDLTTLDDSKSYMAHPDSVLLKNGDILTMYPAGHGKGAVLNKISTDGGLTWNGEIENTPDSWENSRETPTVYRLTFTDG